MTSVATLKDTFAQFGEVAIKDELQARVMGRQFWNSGVSTGGNWQMVKMTLADAQDQAITCLWWTPTIAEQDMEQWLSGATVSIQAIDGAKGLKGASVKADKKTGEATIHVNEGCLKIVGGGAQAPAGMTSLGDAARQAVQTTGPPVQMVTSPNKPTLDEYFELYGQALKAALGVLQAATSKSDYPGYDLLPLAKDMATSAMIAYVRDHAWVAPAKAQPYDPAATDHAVPF